ncbi:MAG: Mur ligase family protein [Gaiellaceae bacterium]
MYTVGITGTNGKSSTTAWIAAALARIATPVARTTTLGSFLDEKRLDLPLNYMGFVETMRRCLAAGGRYAAVELTSEALARGFAKAWPCASAVFTNLTHDHLDSHGSPEHYLASKAQLFLQLPPSGVAILNGCDPASELLAEVVPSGVRIVRYGVATRGQALAPLDLAARSVSLSWTGTSIELDAAGDYRGDLPQWIRVRSVGDVFAENALAAFATVVALGVAPNQAADALSSAEPLPGRFEGVGISS